MADVAEQPTVAAENTAPPAVEPTENPSGMASPMASATPSGTAPAAADASPAAVGAEDQEDGVRETNSMELKMAGRNEAQMRLENDHKDFLICTSIIAIVAVVCAIGIVVIHFMVLSKTDPPGLFYGQDGHYEGGTVDSSPAPETNSSTTSNNTDTSSNDTVKVTTVAPGRRK